MSLEFEDLFLVLGLAAVMNVVSHFFDGKTSAVLQYAVPLSVVPLLMIFKYGKPPGYMRDLLVWYSKPRAYCALAADKQRNGPYLKDSE